MSVDLRLGRWQDVLAGVSPVGSVITDPPYGARTHTGALQGRGVDGSDRLPIDYAHWTATDVHEFVGSWAPRTERWIVAMTSYDLMPAWERAADESGWYFYAPIAAVISGMGVRVLADGPANWTVPLAVMRRRAAQLGSKPGAIWRSLPGGYTGPSAATMGGGRGKPQWLLDALVRDYSDEGHVVCDPFAGWGSTLVAARNAGRIAIGAEESPAVHARALDYLSGDSAAFRRSRPRSEKRDPSAPPSLFDLMAKEATP